MINFVLTTRCGKLGVAAPGVPRAQALGAGHASFRTFDVVTSRRRLVGPNIIQLVYEVDSNIGNGHHGPAEETRHVHLRTRPDSIKIAPVVKRMQESDVLEPMVLVTGQHREMLDQVNELFRIELDIDLNLFKPGQALNLLSSRILEKLDPVLEEHAPDAVLVQGDTTTVAIAAIASFNREIPLIHLEAGLRSGNIHSPSPEEANRKLTSQVTALHLAPTRQSKANLLREGIPAETVGVTGNTVIDALLRTVDSPCGSRITG